MMRRVLAFVLLFGAGFAILKLLDRDGAPNVEPREARGEGREGGSGTRLLPRGSFFHARFDEREGGERVRRYDVAARDSRATPNGDIELLDVDMDFYDEEGDELMSSLSAASAIGRVLLGDGGEPRLASRLELVEALLRVESGNRLVPLELESPTLEGDLDTGVFATEDRAVVRGTGLAASGSGLDVDLERGRVEFRKASSLSITTERGVVATLAAAGPLTFERDDAAPGNPLSVVARQLARLVVADGRGTVLEADRIEVRGKSAGESGEQLRFDELVATGGVVVRSEGRRFEAQRATFELDSEGRPVGARLEGNPRALLPIDPDDPSSAPEDLARVWGRGPMTLAWPHPAPSEDTGGEVEERPRTFQIAGPARFEWGGAELWALGGIHSSIAGEREPIAFRAWGDVEVKRDGWTLRTPEVEGTAEEEVLDFTARGPGTIDGIDDDGAKLNLLAHDGFRFRWRDEAWSVPWARGVVLEWDGERSLSARAQRVEDLSADLARDALAFTAIGAVEVSSGDHFLRGERLVARSLTDGELHGADATDDAPAEAATYVSPWGEVAARVIARDGDRVRAEGDVTASFDVRGLVAGTLHADRISITGVPPTAEEADGRPAVLEAEGDVAADVVHGGDRHEFTTAWLRVERSPGPTEASTAGGTRLAARGGVEGLIERAGVTYDLRADELVAEAEDQGLGPDDRLIAPTGTAVALGGVRLERIGEDTVVAEGERLVLDHQGGGRLEALPGRRVRAFGSLPGGERPFELDAVALEFHATDELVALHPRIDIEDRAPTGDLQRAAEALAPKLAASAERLVATRERIVLTGECRVDGHTAGGAPWSLLSDRATLVAAPGDGDEAAFDTLTAEGDVVARFADGRRAEGDRIVAEGWSRELRLEALPGRVAKLIDRNMVWEATFIELDTVNLLPRTGPGTSRQRRADDVDPRSETW